AGGPLSSARVVGPGVLRIGLAFHPHWASRTPRGHLASWSLPDRRVRGVLRGVAGRPLPDPGGREPAGPPPPPCPGRSPNSHPPLEAGFARLGTPGTIGGKHGRHRHRWD